MPHYFNEHYIALLAISNDLMVYKDLFLDDEHA